MHLWRVIMSVHLIEGRWKSSVQKPTFYVHGMDREAAKAQALAVTGTAMTDCRTSGSLIKVDKNLDPVLDALGMNPAEADYLSWSDLK
jgi:hypothetical protein